MAQKTQVILISDLTGEEIDSGETIEFALDNVSYEIDLSDAEAKQLRKAFDKYTSAARKVGGRRSSGTAKRSSSETKAIKAWADEQGIDYPQRGRLPQTLIEAYKSAH